MPSRNTSWWYVSGAAVACAGVLIAANLAFARKHSDAAEVLPAAAPAVTSAAPRPDPSAAPEVQDNTPIGPVTDTGIKAAHGTWVLYLIGISDKAIPGTHFGVMLGRRVPGGKLTADVVTNDTSGHETSAGFHAGEGSMQVSGGTTPVFGYYAGPAVKVTGTAHGKKVTGHLAASGRAGVQIYWFDTAGASVTRLAAYDAHGAKLPTGDSAIGVG